MKLQADDITIRGIGEFGTAGRRWPEFWNPSTKRVVTIAMHTRKDVGPGLLNRILKDAGIKESKH